MHCQSMIQATSSVESLHPAPQGQAETLLLGSFSLCVELMVSLPWFMVSCLCNHCPLYIVELLRKKVMVAKSQNVP